MDLVHVVAAVLIDAEDRVLIAQRPDGKHLAGGWEFPGGKLEPGEQRRAGLARELREELGIEIAGTAPRPLIRVTHQYPDRAVLLDTWVVRHFRGELRGLDGQALRWCPRNELDVARLLPADGPIVEALRLPERLTQASTADYRIVSAGFEIDISPGSGEAPLVGSVCSSERDAVAAVAAGARFLAVNRGLTAGELSSLCNAVPVPVFARDISIEAAWRLGATGINAL